MGWLDSARLGSPGVLTSGRRGDNNREGCTMLIICTQAKRLRTPDILGDLDSNVDGQG